MGGDLEVPQSSVPAESRPANLAPEAPILEKLTYASPMSFIGITRRGTAWVRHVGTNWWKALLSIAALLAFLSVMYAIIAVWYVIIFGLFGLLTFPYRLVRRSHRKQEHLQKAQLAAMQAMLIQQQQALQQNREVQEREQGSGDSSEIASPLAGG